MPSAFNNQNDFSDKQKKPQKPSDKKFNRTTVLTVLALVVALIIVATAVIVSNRSKAPTKLPEVPDTSKPTDTDAPAEPDSTEPPAEKPTEKPNTSTPTAGKIPSFILPVSGSLSSKHDPDLQVFSPTMNDYRVHLGIDLVTKENAPVYSVADGKISKIWVDPKMGYCLAIAHDGNCLTVYKNLAEELPAGISEGAAVRSGQLIATVGDSAMIEVGSEPHLHFEVTVGELAQDPLKYFDESSLETIKKDSSAE